MGKKELIVFGGSAKSIHFINVLKPEKVYMAESISTKSSYIECLSSIDHSLFDIICVNWPFITPDAALQKSNIYTVHESLLPSFSGCAPINWSIIEGTSIFGLTLFRQSKVIDGGDILFQHGFYSQTIGATSIFKKMESSYEKCAKFILNNDLDTCGVLEDFGSRKVYPKRKPSDNIIEEKFEPFQCLSTARESHSSRILWVQQKNLEEPK